MINVDAFAMMYSLSVFKGHSTPSNRSSGRSVPLIELALGQFPFSQDQASDDSDLEDLQNTLSPGKPLFSASTGQKKSKEDKERKRGSIGVSLQGGARTMSILELLQHIVDEPAPRLTPEGRFPKAAEDIVDACLLNDLKVRKTPKELLVSISSNWGGVFFFSANWLTVRCYHGWNIPGRLTLTSRLGHLLSDHDLNQPQASSICISCPCCHHSAMHDVCQWGLLFIPVFPCHPRHWQWRNTLYSLFSALLSRFFLVSPPSVLNIFVNLVVSHVLFILQIFEQVD